MSRVEPEGLCESVRRHCAAVARSARWVAIEPGAGEPGIEPGPAALLDPTIHYLEANEEDVARYVLTLGAVNFGSGWFPTLRKRPGRSGYGTVAGGLSDRFRAHGPWSNAQLRQLGVGEVAEALGQDPDYELMSLYTQALRDLGCFLGDHTALEAIGAAEGSAERLAARLVGGMELFADHGFYKRAQIVPSDLALAGVADFHDLDRLTIFADNLVPHVLRVDGVLQYHPDLAAHIDAGRPLPAGGDEEREIRACAVHACESIAARVGVAPRILDGWLWNRGQQPAYKAIPRHRTRTVFY